MTFGLPFQRGLEKDCELSARAQSGRCVVSQESGELWCSLGRSGRRRGLGRIGPFEAWWDSDPSENVAPLCLSLSVSGALEARLRWSSCESLHLGGGLPLRPGAPGW